MIPALSPIFNLDPRSTHSTQLNALADVQLTLNQTILEECIAFACKGTFECELFKSNGAKSHVPNYIEARETNLLQRQTRQDLEPTESAGSSRRGELSEVSLIVVVGFRVCPIIKATTVNGFSDFQMDFVVELSTANPKLSCTQLPVPTIRWIAWTFSRRVSAVISAAQ